MNHYLITRFNLRTEEWRHTRQGADVLTDCWLEERFRLFENYCLPSVAQQTNPNFTWCVFFDIETPLKFRKKIEKFTQQCASFTPIYIKSMALLNQSFIEFIENNKKHYFPFVITTRLDNDDIIHKDFIDVVQNRFKLRDNLVIDLRKGFQVNLESKQTEIRKIDFPFNQFISFVENSENKVTTVMAKPHQEWKRHPKVMVYDKEEMWIELIHNSNKLNDARRKFKRTVHFDNDKFGINPNLHFKENAIQVIANNLRIDFLFYKAKLKRKFVNK